MAEGKLSVGNVEVVVLTDKHVDFIVPLNQIFPGVSAEEWAPYQQRYPEAFAGPETIRIHFGGYLLRSQGRTILVDTGLGGMASNPGTVGMFGEGTDGQMIQELQAAGVRPEEIETIIFTHLHPDHVGWNLDRSGSTPALMFPRARYVAHQADWDAFSNPEIQAAFPFPFWEETCGPLQDLGALDLITGELALTDEITALHTPGHTPGHMSILISSQGERALLLGDAAHTPAQATEVEWQFSFDIDPNLAVETRKALWDRAESDNATVVLCHYPSPGRLVRIEGRRYWQSL